MLLQTHLLIKQGYSTENEEAYGCYWGHVWDSLKRNNPDKIALKIITKEKFKEYIKLLFEILSEEGGGTSDGEEHLEKIKVEIDRMECNNNNCMDFHEAMVNVDFIDDENLKKYEKCMNSQSRLIAKSEMQKVMDFIKQGKAN